MKNSLRNAFKTIKHSLKETGIKKLILILVFILLCSCTFTAYQFFEREYISHITLTLNYANGRNGLMPSGARFNILEIKSNEVIKGALSRLGDSSLSVEAVKSRIRINAKMPSTAIDTVESAVAGSKDYSYCPSEFMIYYSQENKFAKNRTDEFLKALAESYKDYFYKNHALRNVVLEFSIDEDFDKYDYNEQYQVISDKIASMLSYLNQRQLENDSFNAKSTGYSFGNLISLLGNVNSVDLEKLNAYIVQNGISKDNKLLVNKQQYSIDRKMLQYNMLYQGSQISKDAMEEYDEHLASVAFIPTVDDQNEFYMARTKTGIDDLATQSYNSGLSAVEKKKVIDKHKYMIVQFGKVKNASRKQSESVEKMISSICRDLNKISKLAVMTDNEYIKEKYNNYITFYHTKTHNYKAYIITFFKILFVLILLALILVVLLEKLKKNVAYRRLVNSVENASHHFIKKAER